MNGTRPSRKGARSVTSRNMSVGVEGRAEPGPECRGKSLVRLTALAVGTFVWLASGAAAASDYYLRGGIGFDRLGDTAFTDVDCSSTAPAALYGCGTGDDGAPYRSVGDFGTVPAIELGLGYAAGPARFELLVEYRPHFTFKGRANFLAPGTRRKSRRTCRRFPGCWPASWTSTVRPAEAGPVRAVRRRWHRRCP